MGTRDRRLPAVGNVGCRGYQLWRAPDLLLAWIVLIGALSGAADGSSSVLAGEAVPTPASVAESVTTATTAPMMAPVTAATTAPMMAPAPAPAPATTTDHGSPGVAVPDDPAGSLDVILFRDSMLHFAPDSSTKYAAPGVTVEDRGRIASTEVPLPSNPPPGRVKLLFALRPVPQDERSMFDRWDRAGSIRLAYDQGPDLELARFITSYGGRTDHEVDVSELAPLLRGPRRFRVFIDTWVTPAWRVDCALRYEPDSIYAPPSWAVPVLLVDSFNRKDHGEGAEAEVTVPPGLARVVLRYVSTGHCTDGRDADEFESKANVISVDGRVVARVHPWRDDCRRYRDRNPYCSRWADGSWSSDYSRSGWCPGVEVLPQEFDLTDHLGPGQHRIRVVIEEMRPEDAQGNYGYWRVSAALVGWDRPPRLWRN